MVETLDRVGAIFKEHDRNAQLVLDEVAAIPDPTILELGAGHGALSRRILDQHPTARVTVSDLNPNSVAQIAASDLGRDPRTTVSVVDATAIDAPDKSFDLAVFALSFHHLPRSRRPGCWPRAPGWLTLSSSSICHGCRHRCTSSNSP